MKTARDVQMVEAEMTMAARALTVILAAATLAASGCGGDSSKKGASTGTPGTGAPAASASIAGCAAEALPAGTSLTGVWIGPAGEVWVAGDDGFVGRRLADGTGAGAWSWCRPGPAVDLHAIWGAAGDDIWAVGDGGTILRWNGATWVKVTDDGSPAPGDLHDVWGETAGSKYGPESVWVVGDAGVVRRFDGTAWSIADADARYALRGVWGSPSGVLRVVGRAALPIIFIDPGAEAVVLRQSGDLEGAWTREAAFQEERGAAGFDRISGASDDDIWACGVKFPSGAAASFAFASHFDGATWSVRAGSGAVNGAPESVLVDRNFTDVGVRPPGAPAGAWFTAGFGTAVRFDGTAWTSDDPVATGLLAIDVRGSAMWAAGVDGKIVRWNGQAWEISSAASPLP
jgi:hypothetical protein